MVDIRACGDVIWIGRQGENEYRRVLFPMNDVIVQYPDATFNVLNRRSEDTSSYVVPASQISVEGTDVCWVLKASDLAYDGDGECEVIAYSGNTVAKDKKYTVRVLDALDEGMDPPDPSWDEYLADLSEIADRAETAETGAAENALKAEGYAVGRQNGEPVDQESPYYHGHAAYFAGEAGVSAATAAGSAGDAAGSAAAAGRSAGSAAGSASAAETAQIKAEAAQAAAENARDQITGMTAEATTLDPGESATASYSDGVLSLGIPRGADGQDGEDGADGYSPSAAVSKSGSTATITITDKTGTTTAEISDGQDGQDGADGYTPQRGTDYWTAEDQAVIISAVEDAVEPEISELKSDITSTQNMDYTWLDVGAWEQGTLKATDGTPDSASNRIRTAGFVSLANVRSLKFSVTNTHKFVIDWYKSDGTLLLINNSTQWQTGVKTYNEWGEAAKFKLLIAKTDNSVLTPVSANIDQLSIYYKTILENHVERADKTSDMFELAHYIKEAVSGMWEQGGFDAGNNGAKMNNTARIRTVGYVDEKYLSVEASGNYRVQTWLFDQNNDFFGFIKSDYTYTSDPSANGLFTVLDLKKVRELFPGYNIKLTGRNTAGSAFAYSDAEQFYAFDYYDLTNVNDYAKQEYVDFLGFENAVAIKKNFVGSISPDNNLSSLPVIVHTSDSHGDWYRFKRAYDCAKKLNADVFACTGDMVRYKSSDDFSYVINTVSTVPFVHCMGNHETFQLATEQEVYKKFIDPFKNDIVLPAGVTYPTYYHKDFANKKIRIISVNQFQSVASGNINHNTVHFHQEQITWFVNTLLSTPADYGVIVMIHTPEQKPVTDSTYTKFKQKNVPFFDDVRYKPITEIIDAFISGGTIQKTYTNGDGYTPAAFAVDADFSSKNTGVEFVAYMSGHVHTDNVSYVPNTTNKQLLLNIVCTNIWMNTTVDGYPGTTYPYYNELNDLGKIPNTQTQDSFNVYAIDRANKCVRIARIGANMPYDLGEKRDYMSIPYAD